MNYQDILNRVDRASRSFYTPPAMTTPQIPVVPYGREQFKDASGWATAAVASVQVSPKTMQVKRYIVIDASQRDWVKQPNPYTNLKFSFGVRPVTASNPIVYSNNQFIPTFATDVNGNAITLPGQYNTQGWFFSNQFYPPYSASSPPGPQIGTDTGYVIQPSGSGFGCDVTPSNVQSLRLIRAILPQRQFLNIPIIPGNTDSSMIQTNVVGRPYSTFSTYPYLLMYVNEYFGNYYGGNESMRRAFSVMTQKTRTQTDFNIDLGVQHYDYEPWGQEAVQLQAQIAGMPPLQITVTDPIGTGFAQNDALSVSLIQSGISNLFLKCFTGSYQYFSSNELRVGDRVTFDPTSLSNMLVAPLTTQAKKDFIIAFTGQTFPVLELLDYVPDSNGIYQPRTGASERTAPYNTSYNGFLIPNLTTSDAQGNVTPSFPNSIDANSNVLDPNQLLGSNLPFLNVALQPVYTLELTCVVPDTSGFRADIVS
jgi:hypothetical protein